MKKIKLNVVQMECRLTSKLSKFLKSNEISLNSLNSDLEWFLTWRIKLEDLENRMWRDGVQDLEISKSGKHTVDLEGLAYIGPENNVKTIYKSKIEGKISLSKKHDSIESYNFRANVNGKLYEIVK